PSALRLPPVAASPNRRSPMVHRPPSVARALAPAALCVAALALFTTPARASWPANGRALCTATGDQNYPAMTTDGSGGAIVAWEDRRGGASDVYAMRVGPNGTLTAGCPADGRALCTA